MQHPLVHVLVINWNGLEHLDACFATLLDGAYENVRYILLDNASTDGSVAFVREHFGHDPRVEFMEFSDNLGWSGANNAGMERALAAGAKYVFLLNNDTATDRDAVERLVAAAEAEPGIGALAPKMLLYDNPALLNSLGLECSLIGNSWDRGLGRLDGPRWNEEREVIGVCGGALFLRAEALRKTGLLPADFGIYLDDLDLCLRIWDAGYRVRTCPGAVVKHKFSATMGTGKRLRQKYFLNTRNRFRVVERNFPALKLPTAAMAMALGEFRAVGRAVLNREGWRIAAHARAWGDAVTHAPAALRERRRKKGVGLTLGRFWSLVESSPMFFPGVPLPQEGWYTEHMLNGQAVRPMSAAATLTLETSQALTLLNRYPDLGPAEVEVWCEGSQVALLEATQNPSRKCGPISGTIELRARRIFYAEDTGQPVDFGGWIAVHKA